MSARRDRGPHKSPRAKSRQAKARQDESWQAMSRPADLGPLDRPIELRLIARQAGVRVPLVRRYLAFGLFEACGGTSEAPLYDPSCTERLARAERLRRDLDLNYAGAVLAIELLDRIIELEDRLR